MAAHDGAARYAAVVLAGGGAHRLGGVDKPALMLGGKTLLARVLDAVADAAVRIVVGPPRDDLPPEVLCVREQPPGGGPVSGIAAGLALVPPGLDHVGLFAGDLPFLTPEAVRELRATAAEASAAYVDDHGRRQYLCAMWRTGPLRERLAAVGGPDGVPLRRLYDDALMVEVRSRVDPPPWYDCDTEADLERAQQWVQRA